MMSLSDPSLTSQKESLLEFPCRFPIKAMGRHSDEFKSAVATIVLRHAQMWPDEELQHTPSREGNFLSVTAIVEATSQEQLDAIYQELTDCELVIMAL